jgi:hypothetical protein
MPRCLPSAGASSRSRPRRGRLPRSPIEMTPQGRWLVNVPLEGPTRAPGPHAGAPLSAAPVGESPLTRRAPSTGQPPGQEGVSRRRSGGVAARRSAPRRGGTRAPIGVTDFDAFREANPSCRPVRCLLRCSEQARPLVTSGSPDAVPPGNGGRTTGKPDSKSPSPTGEPSIRMICGPGICQPLV